jgi:hypothetical protein
LKSVTPFAGCIVRGIGSGVHHEEGCDLDDMLA